ncbi:nifR3 family TIM-barrel protein [Desulfoprunum benzoelyticum]|uniref:tRNA-dihydrouridine synthase n=1 Tax=Desulfoprunum benzoelyticum TaxID=1506996 RepID=A0A840UJ91_9BACT|nr:nifR3 family TIM-barrel protein [Desulfoprunum benzoelyticum]
MPFRLLCREYGAGFCVSEMISCHGLCYRQQKTIDMLLSTPAERPVAFQLFGADPDRMAEAAAIISTFGPDMIDINMGCPVKKVTKRGAGAALMASPELAEKIILRVVANTSLPVTVKIRAGIKASEVNGTEFARMAQGSGASAVIVHGRTWAQGFSGQADRTIIAAIKQALTIPVIGNGDIQTYQEAMEMLEETGCDGVMIGRAALGNPWVFSAAGRPGDLGAIVDGALRHLNLVEQFLGANRPISVIRNHIGKYFKNLPGSSDIRRAVYNCPALTDLKNLLLAFRDINEEIGTTAITGGAA